MAKNILTVTIQQQDDSGNTLARRNFTVTDAAPAVGEFLAGKLIDTSQTTITVPTAQPRQIVFRNTHASAKITVVWTPYGGAEVTINKIGPGDMIALFGSTAAATGIGISSIKLTSDIANATYELFIGG